MGERGAGDYYQKKNIYEAKVVYMILNNLVGFTMRLRETFNIGTRYCRGILILEWLNKLIIWVKLEDFFFLGS